MADKFENHTTGLDDPAEDAEATTFGADYSKVTRALLLEEAGLVRVITKKGTDITLPLQAGWNPIRVRQCVSSPTLANTKIFGVI